MASRSSLSVVMAGILRAPGQALRRPVNPSRCSGQAHRPTSGRHEESATGRPGRLLGTVGGLEVAVVDHLPAPAGFDDEAGAGITRLGYLLCLHRQAVSPVHQDCRVPPGPSASSGNGSQAVARFDPHGIAEAGAEPMRKVHHPKIVQRADSRWMVVCQDCERERDQPAAPVGINTPLDSRAMAQRLWENHCERGRAFPVRRGA